MPSLWHGGMFVHVPVPVYVEHCTKLAEPIECPMVGSLLALVLLPTSVRGYHARGDGCDSLSVYTPSHSGDGCDSLSVDTPSHSGDGCDSLSVDTPSHSVCAGLQRLMACACCCGRGDHVSRRVVMPPNTTHPFPNDARPSTWYM